MIVKPPSNPPFGATSDANTPSFATELGALIADPIIKNAARNCGWDLRTIRRWLKGTRPRRDMLARFINDLTSVDVLTSYQRVKLLKAYTEQFEGPSLNSEWDSVKYIEHDIFERMVPPTVPAQSGPGPAFRPTASGFDIEGHPPPDEERSDPIQVSLHRRLQLHAHRLQASIVTINNTHTALAEEFQDYCQFLSADLVSLDVASLWSVGTGLAEQLLASTASGPGVLTPDLEPGILGEFYALIRDHTAFIQGFSVGRELQERVVRVREAAQANPNLQAQSEAILRPMTSIPRLLAEKARRMVEALTRALATTPSAAFDLLASSTDVGRNSIVAFARVLTPIIVAADASNIALLLAGHEHAEVMQAAVIYFRDNLPHVMALFAQDQEIANWLAWLIKKLHDLEI
jgi:hypothetical protein